MNSAAFAIIRQAMEILQDRTAAAYGSDLKFDDALRA